MLPASRERPRLAREETGMHMIPRLASLDLQSTLRAAAWVIMYLLVLLTPISAWAIEELSIEEDIADLIVQSAKPERGTTQERQWAILPQLGYGPDTGPVVGVKFTHRDLFGTGMTFDLDATYAALNQRQSHGVKLLEPHLADDRFLIALYGKYRFDPQREFFTLGNNDRGPDPASTHAYQEFIGVLTVGWRPLPRVAVNVSAMAHHEDIRRGHRRSDCAGLVPCPYTVDEFPLMPGIKGGTTYPLSASLVWNGRDDVVRPTRGWRVLLKGSHTNKSLLSDFEFTQVVGDIGYLYPWFNQRVISGIRLDGVWMDGPFGRIPFWELPDLGGSDSLRGFFPHRFAGKNRLLVNLELRGLLTEFDFYQLWHVKLDGVVFGETGRVFLDHNDFESEFHAAPTCAGTVGPACQPEPAVHLVSHLQYSYGGGLRIELSEALVARLDAGFSDEEKGLFYLTFGQTF